jgi:hypothetical protein
MLSLLAILLSFTTAVSSGISASEPPVVSSIDGLADWLAAHPLTDAACAELAKHELGLRPLTSDEARTAAEMLWESRKNVLRKERQAEMDAREIVIGDLRMPFWYRSFGEASADGRSLYISMHGGGGAPAAVNDQQYENQKRLYKPEEGIYLVPRARQTHGISGTNSTSMTSLIA